MPANPTRNSPLSNRPDPAIDTEFPQVQPAPLSPGVGPISPQADEKDKIKHAGVHDLFARVASERGSAVALDCEGKLTTYRELAGNASRLANLLLAKGLRKGDVVAIMLGDPARVIAAIIAVLDGGGIFAPLDTKLPPLRIQNSLSIIEPNFIIYDQASPRLQAEAFHGCSIEFDGVEHLSQSDQRPMRERSGEEPCSIYFTSGSTGKPKAILGRLKGIDHFVLWEIRQLGIDQGSRVSQLTSSSFDGFLKDVFAPLCAGGVCCIPSDRSVILEPSRLADWIDVQEISILHCVPSVFRSLLQAPLRSSYFPELKAVVLSGEAVLPSDVARWKSIFGHRVELLNLYGPTETTITKFIYRIQPGDENRAAIPIGVPMPGAEAMILNPAGKLGRKGAVGEIYICTPYRALGYFNAPAETTQAFVPNPFGQAADDRLYRTGDFGRQMEDGSFEFLGRKDQQVKIRGARVEIGEVENTIRTFPSVKDVAVVDYEDRQASRQLCAYVVYDSEQSTSSLHDYLGDRLPSHMVPGLVIPLPALPRTFNGKIDRRNLPQPQETVQKTYEAPENTLEEVLCTIYEGVLQRTKVGRHDDFFELGGHSLLATQVVSRIRSAFNIDLPLRTLFASPAVADLAKMVMSAQESTGKVMPLTRAVRSNEGGVLSFEQERMWFLDQLTGNGSAYNMPFSIRLRGDLDMKALEASINEVVRRHEVLRTHYPEKDGKVTCHVYKELLVPLPVTALQSSFPGLEEQQAYAIADREAREPFDLLHGPVVRARLLKLGQQDHVLLVSVHHIAADGWSTGVMIREFSTLYRAYAKGEVSPLAELPIQYGDYAVWQRKWLQGEVLEERLAYWDRQLAGADTRFVLPGMRPRPAVPSFKGARKPFKVNRELLEALRVLGQQEGTTLFMSALSVLLVLLQQYTGEEDLVVGSIIANRDRAELEPLIGFLGNTIVLRTNLAESPSFRELLKRVREVCLDAFAHQIPPEKLMERRAREAVSSKKPLYDVWFQVDRARQQRLQLAGLEWENFNETSSDVVVDLPFELSLVLFEEETGPTLGEVIYDTSLFPEETIDQLIHDYIHVMEIAVQSPDQPIEQFTLDPADENASSGFLVAGGER